MNKNITGILFLLIALVCIAIAAYMVITMQNNDQYGWFLFVGFLFGSWAYKQFN